MRLIKKELVIIGGGPAGMGAAVAAYESGLRDILILEREDSLGGILRQCIHNGFGLHRFGEELTGPEYAARYENRVRELDIPFKLNTTVLSLSDDKVITAANEEDGIFKIEAGAVILAMGCRERPKGALNIGGTRPSGVFSAGAAQKLVNMKGYLPGKRVVILGSGDIGLIMARRMTLEGAKVVSVFELMPYSGGLARNIEQCLNDFDIPLRLSTTVVELHGADRLEGVTVARVDEDRRPIDETREFIPCDTLLLSVGLIPENELTESAGIMMDRTTGGAVVDQSRQTCIPGIFACGNVLHVHDLVDFVSEEAEIAGKSAARYLLGDKNETSDIPVKAGGIVRYTVPERISEEGDVTVFFRVTKLMRDAVINVLRDGKVVFSKARRKVAPAEMESIKIGATYISGAKNITVEVVGK